MAFPCSCSEHLQVPTVRVVGSNRTTSGNQESQIPMHKMVILLTALKDSWKGVSPHVPHNAVINWL